MELHFETGTVVGKTSDTAWGQIIKTVHAFGVVEVYDEEGHARQIGMEVVRRLTEYCSGEISSVSAVFDLVDDVWTPTIQTLLLCVPVKDVMTVILRGTGAVYLKRDGHIALLRSREGTISGAIHPSDIIFLSSKSCLHGVAEEELFSFFDHAGVLDIAEKLTLHLYKKNTSDGYAGLFVEVRTAAEDQHAFADQEQKKDHVRVSTQTGQSPVQSVVSRVKKRARIMRDRVKGTNIKITIALGVLFLICVAIGVVREYSGKQNTEVIAATTQGQQLYDEGIALMELNSVKSKERLTEALVLIQKTKSSVSPKTKEGRTLDTLEGKITEALSQVSKEYDITPELFFDVALLKSGGKVGTFGLYEDTIALLDTSSSTVFTLGLAAKNGQVAAGGALFADAQQIGIHGDTVYVYTPEGIHAVNVKDKTVRQYVIKKADDWSTIRAMVAFGGNIYLLDTGKSRIWKYVATSSAFSDLREYLLPDFFPDLSHASSMAIDGSVWVGTTDGVVHKYTQGKEDVFVTKGVDPPFGAELFVYTDDELTYVYVLDPANSRVVVLEKDGMYNAQYRYPSTFAPRLVAASEKLGKLFLFADGKLYASTLK